MKRTMKLIAVTVVVALVMVGISGATVAHAQDGTATPAPKPGQIVRILANALLDSAAKALKMDKLTIVQAMRKDKTTLADVITAHKGDVSKVEADAKTAVTKLINDAVKSGKITQDQANTMLGKLDDALNKLLNQKFPDLKNVGVKVLQARALQLLAKETATESKIKPKDVLKGLADGKTLAQIATEHGADPVKIVSATVQTATTQINKAVSAGKISQEQADKVIAGLQDGFTKAMNTVHPLEQIAAGSTGNANATPQPAGTPGL